jgi:hypothetical protein
MAAVVALAKSHHKSFSEDPRGGPWASVIRTDAVFATSYANVEVGKYRLLVTQLVRNLFDRDTAPGAEPEDLMTLNIPTLIVPGRDASHATSAARYLEECIPNAAYWDAAPEAQTEQASADKLLNFLKAAT